MEEAWKLALDSLEKMRERLFDIYEPLLSLTGTLPPVSWCKAEFQGITLKTFDILLKALEFGGPTGPFVALAIHSSKEQLAKHYADVVARMRELICELIHYIESDFETCRQKIIDDLYELYCIWYALDPHASYEHHYH